MPCHSFQWGKYHVNDHVCKYNILCLPPTLRPSFFFDNVRCVWQETLCDAKPLLCYTKLLITFTYKRSYKRMFVPQFRFPHTPIHGHINNNNKLMEYVVTQTTCLGTTLDSYILPSWRPPCKLLQPLLLALLSSFLFTFLFGPISFAENNDLELPWP